MSPGCPQCPPVLLALLLGLAQSQGSQECRDQDVTAGASLCLVPEELPRELQEIRWRGKTDLWLPVMIALRDGSVSYSKGRFHGRAEFQPAILSLCVSPVHEADSSVYRAEFENSAGNSEIFPRCFQVFLWDPILEPDLKSQIQHWDLGWCRLSLLCSSPGTRNVSIRWECPKDSPGLLEFPGSLPQLIQKIPENAKLQICHCNQSSPTGWRAAQASCTCAEILGNSGLWNGLVPIVVVVVVVVVVLGMLGICCWWRRRKRRRENSEEFL